MSSAERQNKRSEVGEAKGKGHQAGAGHVHDIEHVGSSGSHGVRFKMPDCHDHSDVMSTPEHH